jgi:hypothetical protein
MWPTLALFDCCRIIRRISRGLMVATDFQANTFPYRTQTVTFCCELSLAPIFSTTGWGPEPTPAGTTTFTCSTLRVACVPWVPAYKSLAGWPPIVTVTGWVVKGSGLK